MGSFTIGLPHVRGRVDVCVKGGGDNLRLSHSPKHLTPPPNRDFINPNTFHYSSLHFSSPLSTAKNAHIVKLDLFRGW